LDTTQPQECDLRMVRKDGTVFFAQLSATAAQDEAGAPVCRVTLNDISERRRAENEILASEEKHRRLFETMAQGVVYQDSDGKIISANPAAQKILGLSLDEMNGKTSMDPDWMTVREDGSPLPGQEHPSMTALHTGKTVGPFVMGVKNPRASCTVWISVNATPLFQPNETKPFQVYTTFDDITARKNAEAKRTESDARFRSYFELPLHGTCITSPEKGWLEVNDSLCEILGYTRQEIFSKTWAEMTHPGDLAADVAQFDRILSGEIGQYQLEKRFICKDGTVIWTEISVGCVRKSDGTVDHFICLMEDISERKKAEESLLNLRAAVEQSANTIAITDIRGNIEYVNPAFEKNTGYTAAEAIGKTHRILKSGEQDAEFYRHLWATITSGKIWQGEFHNRRKDGSLYWELATISPVQNDKGETVRYLAIKEDITEQKAMEASLATALLRAEAGNRAKSEFLNVMSHELRTPLNGVLGFAQLLSDTLLDNEQKSFAKTISSSGEHLLAIVSDILDFASIDAGTLALHAAPLVVADLVKTAEDTVRINAAEKGLELSCELAADVPEQITGDELRIRQILINLLGNAVKFTASGSVVLRVVPTFENGGSFLDFCVEDTGIGISSETLDRLFQPFVQADSKMNRPFGGTGIGLAICKRLAESMGGAITVASTPGRGSTFTFRLTLEVPAGGRASVPSHSSDREGNKSALTEHRPPLQTGATPTPSSRGLVLVVEDDQASGVLAGKMLQSLGYRAEFATDGTEAVKAFVPGKYSAVLMDVSMPAMGGLEATAKIREAEVNAGCHVQIIALTANVMHGDRDRCLAAGMDDFLAKPFKKEELAAKLASVAQR